MNKPQLVVVSFHNLNVNAVETNSGIFIGSHNAAHGWSSHHKTNSGFGSTTNATTTQCVSIVFDNDVVDAPINDADQFAVGVPLPAGPSAGAVSFHDINTNAIHTNSTISVGEVEQTGWSSHQKANSGVRGQKGINLTRGDFSAIIDNDVIDSPILDENWIPVAFGDVREGKRNVQG